MQANAHFRANSRKLHKTCSTLKETQLKLTAFLLLFFKNRSFMGNVPVLNH